MRARSKALTALVALLALAGCGEQEVDLTIPEREEGQVVLDQADVLDAERVADALSSLDPVDAVAVVYETPQANAGEADRAGEAVNDAWGSDVALVAVAVPSDFASEDEATRERFFGVRPAGVRDVPASLRERLAEEIVPPLAADNQWTAAFVAAAEALADELE